MLGEFVMGGPGDRGEAWERLGGGEWSGGAGTVGVCSSPTMVGHGTQRVLAQARTRTRGLRGGFVASISSRGERESG